MSSRTAIQRGFGHIYGPGNTAKSDGAFPVWLEQNGSRIMGGLIDLSYKLDGTHKVSEFWPKSIRTATPCVELGSHNYAPVPTYRVLENVSATDTVVKIAKQDGLPLIVAGMSLALASDATKKVTVAANKVATDATDGFYKLTITANDFGVLSAGDVLILEAFANSIPVGLTKSNLEYEGVVDADNTKLNITLCDDGRVIADTAPAASAKIRTSLQTIKWEDVY